MINQPQASKLASEAFSLWQEGQRERAALLYEEALELADPSHWGLSAYHGEFACVLNELGKHGEATSQLEKSLAAELAQGNAEGSPSVTIARYFLANQLLERGAPEQALEILTPSILAAPTDWVTRMAEAQVLFSLNRAPEARYAAECAIANAPTQSKKEELSQHLSSILGAAHG